MSSRARPPETACPLTFYKILSFLQFGLLVFLVTPYTATGSSSNGTGTGMSHTNTCKADGTAAVKLELPLKLLTV